MRRPHSRRGTILIVAIGVLMILTGFTLVFCRQMRIEALASANYVAGADASTIERAAEQFAIAEIVDQQDAVLNLPDTTFAAVPVGDGYFWILRPDYGDDSLPTFGLVDEASKLNINTTPSILLQNLPGMTAELADSIEGWVGKNPNTAGIDDGYYQTLASPYQSKVTAYGPANYDTVEELLLVRGMTHAILYGDPQSSSLNDPQLARGLYDLFTVYSKEPAASSTGTGTINISNPSSSGRLQNLLRQTLGLSNNRAAQEANQLISNSRNYKNVFQVAAALQMNANQLSQIADQITTGSTTGLVNLNTATRDVLIGIGLDEGDADSLIGQRPTIGSSTDISWAYTALGPAKARNITSGLTGHSYQYSADIIAVSGNGRSFKRFRVVIDTTPSAAAITAGTATTTTPPPPRIIYRRDITDSGFPLDNSILTSLRQGAGLPANATSPQARRSL